jgi:hypothetical protein
MRTSKEYNRGQSSWHGKAEADRRLRGNNDANNKWDTEVLERAQNRM